MEPSAVPMRVWRLVAALSLLIFFAGFDHDVWGPDESRVAGIALEMADTGELVIPHLGGTPFVEKPPIYFMLAAASARCLEGLIGAVPAIRLSSVLWGLATAWCVYLLARLLARTSNEQDGGDARADAPTTARPALVGLLALIILSTMPGFLSNAQNIRTDIALTCLVTATTWAFASAYLEDRPAMLSVAGLLLAGAFLAKGLIGIVFVGSAWLGLFPLWLWRRTRADGRQPLWIGAHLLCLGLFALGVGAWVLLLRLHGGQELFDEWFWRNQLGRLDGTGGLGHDKSGELLFYVKPLLVHGLPWSPLVLVWLATAGSKLATEGTLLRRRRLDPQRLLLAAWLGISLVVLSVASSKRHVYALPLVPVLSLMAADVAGRGMPRWCRGFLRVWIALALVVLGLAAVLPALGDRLPASALERLGDEPIPWALANLVAGLCLALGVWFAVWRRVADPMLRAALVTAVAIVGVATVTTPIVDRVESARAAVLAFGEQVPVGTRGRVAGSRFSEGLRGLFYLHLRWPVPQVPPARVATILAGADEQFASVIVRRPDELEQLVGLPTVTLATGDPNDEALSWLAPSADP